MGQEEREWQERGQEERIEGQKVVCAGCYLANAIEQQKFKPVLKAECPHDQSTHT